MKEEEVVEVIIVVITTPMVVIILGGGGGYGNSGYNSNSGPQYNLGPQCNQSKSQRIQGQSQSNKLTCQICGKNGHLPIDCYHRMDFAYQGKHALAKLASMVANSSQVQNYNGWLTDTGYSDHVTPNLSQLSLHQQPVASNETVTIGNGQGLPVTHIGHDEF